MTEFLLIELNDDTLEAAKELIKELPEGLGRIISIEDLAELVTQSREKPEMIPDPDYGLAARRARAGWFRNRGEKLRTFMGFSHSRV